jgi:hypothetical protein
MILQRLLDPILVIAPARDDLLIGILRADRIGDVAQTVPRTVARTTLPVGKDQQQPTRRRRDVTHRRAGRLEDRGQGAGDRVGEGIVQARPGSGDRLQGGRTLLAYGTARQDDDADQGKKDRCREESIPRWLSHARLSTLVAPSTAFHNLGKPRLF